MSDKAPENRRLTEVLGRAGEKDAPPAKLLAAVAAAVAHIIKNDKQPIEGKEK